MGIWSDDQRHGGGVMVTLDDLYFEGNFTYNKMTVSKQIILCINQVKCLYSVYEKNVLSM